MRVAQSMPVSVGIIGHRELGDEGRVRRQLRGVLESIRLHAEDISRQCRRQCLEVFAEPPRLRLVSCLCRGADQLAAEEALALGYRLVAILPLPRDTLRNEDEQAEREDSGRLDILLARADAVIELAPEDARAPAAKEPRQQAYHDAGLRLLSCCDVLVAVWRGDAHASVGTTSGLLAEARNRGIPVIWLHSEHANDPLLLLPGEAGKDGVSAARGLGPLLGRTLGFAAVAPRDIARSTREIARCLQEVSCSRKTPRPGNWITWCQRSYISLWGRFIRLFYTPSSSGFPPGPEESDAVFRLFDARAQALANAYRSSLLAACFLGALAVICAAGALLSENFWCGLVFGILEILALTLIVVNHTLSTRREWQKRLTEHRFLAECLRCLAYVRLWGFSIPRVDRHFCYRDEDGWLHWLARVILNSSEPENLQFRQPEQFAASRESLKTFLRSQAAYHKTNTERMQAVYSGLHHLTDRLFRLTFFAVTLHIILEFYQIHGPALGMLSFVCIAFPVIGMSSHTLCHYAELKRLVERSNSMHTYFSSLDDQLQNATTASQMASIANAAARRMLLEVVDWKVQYKLPDIVLA